VFNLYGTLDQLKDQKGMQELVERENRLGADYLATAIRIDKAYTSGNPGEAANIGLAYWKTERKEGRAAIGGELWSVLLQLGFPDEASRLGPAPDFAPDLWKLDPKGLDLMESHHIDAKTFFTLEPLTENAGRMYLLSGRGKTLANLYLSLRMPLDQFFKLTHGDVPDDNHFLYCAPLVAIALKDNGHADQANGLVAFAESKAKARPGKEPINAFLLARILAAQGRKQDALVLLTSVINRGYIPEAPQILPDLKSDPALASLRGDPRFEASRQQLLGTIARERAQVNQRLLDQLRTA
jgi:hypothetical protein